MPVMIGSPGMGEVSRDESRSAGISESQTDEPILARPLLPGARRVVVKVGSSLVTDDGKGIDRNAVDAWIVDASAESILDRLLPTGMYVLPADNIPEVSARRLFTGWAAKCM